MTEEKEQGLTSRWDGLLKDTGSFWTIAQWPFSVSGGCEQGDGVPARVGRFAACVTKIQSCVI